LVQALPFSRGVGPATVAAAHRTLSAMLGYAIDEGLIVRNVAESVDLPRQAPSERDSLTRAEAQALLALGDPQWSLVLLSGARDAEIRALRRGDVNLETRRLTISWTIAEAGYMHGWGGSCGKSRSANDREKRVREKAGALPEATGLREHAGALRLGLADD
jgi:integrase